MCVFSGPVDSVSNTNIFARNSAPGRQLLVYSTILSTRMELAMVLPLPVPPGSPEDAVSFIDLRGAPDLFRGLHQLFVGDTGGYGGHSGGMSEQPKLAVVKMGAFIASFVPTIADFSRLDPCFRLPDRIWSQVPAYEDYGFAVVMLSPGKQKLHPIAFEFPRRDQSKLFFPTVHVHDGRVRPVAEFDHTLYLQLLPGEPQRPWEASGRPAKDVVDTSRTAGIVIPDEIVYRREMSGYMPNTDTYV